MGDSVDKISVPLSNSINQDLVPLQHGIKRLRGQIELPIKFSKSLKPSKFSDVQESETPQDSQVKNKTKFNIQNHRVLPVVNDNYPLQYAYGLMVPGNGVAYVADGDAGLKTFNIVDSNNIQLLGSYNTPGSAYDVALQSVASVLYAVVADYNGGLQIINVNTPTSLSLTGSLAPPAGGLTRALVISYPYVYTAEYSKGLRITTISTISSPSQVSNLVTPGLAIGIAIQGTTVFLPSDTSGCHIINVATPASPTLTTTYSTTPQSASDAYVKGSLLFLIAGYNLDCVDITGSPKLKGRYISDSILKSIDVTPSLHHVLTASTFGGLQIVDVRNNSQLVLAGQLDIPHARALKVIGNDIYLNADGMGLVTIKQQKVIPKVSATYRTSGECRSVVLSTDKKFAYAINSYGPLAIGATNELLALDVSNSKSLVFTSSLAINSAFSVSRDGNLVFVSALNTGWFIVNATLPTNLNIINQYTSAGSTYASVVKGNYAYLANYNLGLVILDKSNLNNLVVKSTGGPTTAISVAVDNNNHVFLGELLNLRCFDATIPTGPVLKSSVPLTTYPYGIAIQGKKVFIANSDVGIKIIDYTSYVSPVVKSTTNVGGSCIGGIQVVGDHLYVAAYHGGVPIYDISDDTIPDKIGEYKQPGGVYDVFIADRKAYVAHSVAGFDVVDEIIPSEEPILVNHQLVLHRGQTVVITSSFFSATDSDNDPNKLIYNVSDVLHGYFEYNNNAGTAIFQFSGNEINNGLVRFVHDGTGFAPSFKVSVDDGYGAVPTTPTPATITFMTTAPYFVNNKMTLSQGQTVIVNTNFIQAKTASGDIDPNLLIKVRNTSHVQFERASNPGIAITSFLQKEILEGSIRLVHDNTENPGSYELSVGIVNLESAYSACTMTYINRPDPPVLVTNKLSMDECGTHIFSDSDIHGNNADGNAQDLEVLFSSLQHITLRSLYLNRVITNAQQKNITLGHIEGTHDCSEFPPNMQVAVRNSAGLQDGPKATAVTFNNIETAPILTNKNLSVQQGQSLVITEASVDCTDPDTSDDNVIFEFSNILHGTFIKKVGEQETVITQCSKSDIKQRTIIFKHDNSEFVPSFDIRVGNKVNNVLTFLSAPVAAVINYTPVNDAPSIITNKVTLPEGQAVILTTNEINVTDIDNPIGSIRIFVINPQRCQFELVSTGQVVTDFLMSQLISGDIRIRHDGSELPASYQLTANDGSLTSNPSTAQVTMVPQNDPPVLTNRQITVSQGGSIAIALPNFDCNDPDTDDSEIIFEFSNILHGKFINIGDIDTAITQFSRQDIKLGLIRFIHDNSEFASSFNVRVGDGQAYSASIAATINYTPVNDAPSIITNSVTLPEGQTVVLTTNDIQVSDVDSPVGSIRIFVINPQRCQFELVSTGQVVTDFLMSQLISGNIRIRHDGSELPASYQLTANDGSLTSNPSTAQVTMVPQNDPPVLTNRQITVSQGGSIAIALANFDCNDPDTDDSEIIFEFSNILHGKFINIGDIDTAITQCTRQDIKLGLIRFIHDNSELAPSFNVRVGDGQAYSTSIGATINYTPVNDAPSIITNSVTLPEGQTVVLTTNDIQVSDVDSLVGNIRIFVTNPQHCQFELVSTGLVVTDFLMSQLISGDIRIRHDGSESAASFQLTANDGSLTSNPSTAIVTMVPQNDPPVLTNRQVTVAQGGSTGITLANFDCNDPDTDDSDIIFELSNILHGKFINVLDPDTEITQFTRQDIKLGLIRFIHDNSEFATSFDIRVGDGQAYSAIVAATINYTPVNDAPFITKNSVTLPEGEAVVLTTNDIQVDDVDSLVGNIRLFVTNTQHCQFELVSTGEVVTDFLVSQLISSDIRIRHDGSELPASYQLTANDGSLNSNPSTAIVTMVYQNDPPVLTNHQIAVTQGGSTAITLANFDCDDSDNENSEDIFEVRNVLKGKFVNIGDQNTAITQFSKQEIKQGFIRFIHDNTEGAPSFEARVGDGQAYSSWATGIVDYTPVDNPPSVDPEQEILISEGDTVAFSIVATDPDSPDSDIVLNIEAEHAVVHMKDSMEPLSLVKQTDAKADLVKISHDGSNEPPRVLVQAADKHGASPKTPIKINFQEKNDAPVLTVNKTPANKLTPSILESVHLAAVDEETPAARLKFVPGDLVDVQFEYVDSPGVAIASFYQEELARRDIRHVPLGPNPSYSMSVMDSEGLPSLPQPAINAYVDVPELEDNSFLKNLLSWGGGGTLALGTGLWATRKVVDWKMRNTDETIYVNRQRLLKGMLQVHYISSFKLIANNILHKLDTTNIFKYRSYIDTERLIIVFENIILELGLHDTLYSIENLTALDKIKTVSDTIVREINKLFPKAKCCTYARCSACCCGSIKLDTPEHRVPGDNAGDPDKKSTVRDIAGNVAKELANFPQIFQKTGSQSPSHVEIEMSAMNPLHSDAAAAAGAAKSTEEERVALLANTVKDVKREVAILTQYTNQLKRQFPMEAAEPSEQLDEEQRLLVGVSVAR